MANRNNNFNFQIPGIIILLSFIFCWPVGVVLLVLRSISNENRKNEYKQNNRGYTAQTNKYDYNYSYGNANANVNTNAGSSSNREYTYDKASVKHDEKKASKREKSQLFKLCVGGAVGSFIIAACFFIAQIISGFVSPTPIALAVLFSIFGVGMLAGADYEKKRDTRLRRILAIVGNKKSINLVKLASASNSSIKKIRKDVQKLIDDGMFGDSAYIDLGTNNLMLSPEAEPDSPEMFDYKTLYDSILSDEKKSEKNVDGDEKQKNDGNAGKSDKDHFESIIHEIRRLNDEIEDKEVSEKIDMIEAHTKNIFDYVTENPDSMSQIRTFMNYYLPTTLKLLQSYSRIERVGVAGENMQRSKDNIEKTLDLLVIGFEQQVDQLFRNESIDISSDISVLEQMMQKDGLDGRNDFDINSYVNENIPRESQSTDASSAVKEEYSDDIGDGLNGGAAAQSAPED